jgi:hypothetical protein
MSTACATIDPKTGDNLEQVIEPLASYICASERPRAALHRALAALYSEVAQTNRAAAAQFNSFSGNRRP